MELRLVGSLIEVFPSVPHLDIRLAVGDIGEPVGGCREFLDSDSGRVRRDDIDRGGGIQRELVDGGDVHVVDLLVDGVGLPGGGDGPVEGLIGILAPPFVRGEGELLGCDAGVDVGVLLAGGVRHECCDGDGERSYRACNRRDVLSNVFHGSMWLKIKKAFQFQGS